MMHASLVALSFLVGSTLASERRSQAQAASLVLYAVEQGLEQAVRHDEIMRRLMRPRISRSVSPAVGADGLPAFEIETRIYRHFDPPLNDGRYAPTLADEQLDNILSILGMAKGGLARLALRLRDASPDGRYLTAERIERLRKDAVERLARVDALSARAAAEKRKVARALAAGGAALELELKALGADVADLVADEAAAWRAALALVSAPPGYDGADFRADALFGDPTYRSYVVFLSETRAFETGQIVSGLVPRLRLYSADDAMRDDLVPADTPERSAVAAIFYDWGGTAPRFVTRREAEDLGAALRRVSGSPGGR